MPGENIIVDYDEFKVVLGDVEKNSVTISSGSDFAYPMVNSIENGNLSTDTIDEIITATQSFGRDLDLLKDSIYILLRYYRKALNLFYDADVKLKQDISQELSLDKKSNYYISDGE